jgi:long-chain acyl-CoA synthetase
MNRPFPWEASYPPGMAWDVTIADRTLPDDLAIQTSRHGAHVFMDYRSAETSYAALARQSDLVAAGLLRLGLRQGERVALYLPNTPYHPFSFFGVLKAGGVVVHISPLDAPRELKHKLTDSGARLLITTNFRQMVESAEHLLEAGLIDRMIIGDDAALSPAPGLPVVPIPADDGRIMNFDTLTGGPLPGAWPVILPTDLAILQYTGGTTGIPKGAMHTHASLNAAVGLVENFFASQAKEPVLPERIIAVLPLFHIYALTMMLWQIRLGSTFLLHLRFDVAAVLHDIEVKRATCLPAVPTMLIALAAVPDIAARDLSSLKEIRSGGAPLPLQVARQFERITGGRIGSGWGMTETASGGTATLRHGLAKEGSIGLPLPGIEIQIVSTENPRDILPLGQAGEIRLKGPHLFIGYWNKPEETAKDFVDGFFLTGDIGLMDADGMVFLVDRKKDMIISGGFNVYPRMIEEAIYEHPDVEEVIVIGVPDDYRGQSAKAFVKLRDGAAAFSLDDLRLFLRDRVGRYELPAALEIRDQLPKTPVGKLSKKELVAEAALQATRRDVIGG